MIEQIKNRERIARRLEPDNDARAQLVNNVTAYAQQFLEGTADAPAYVAPDDEHRASFDASISNKGIDLATLLATLDQHVDTPGVNPTSGRFMGYIPGGGLFYSALGDFLAAVTNRYAGVHFASPGAVQVENALLEWMAEVVGYPATSAGNLTSGGSIANLIGIVTARDSHSIKADQVKRAVVYTTEHAHHSVDKALRIAGLGACVRRTIPVDEHYRMQAPALSDAIERDRQEGRHPWLIIGSAGTTNTGSVDPLDAIADVAAANDLWFHVDGAYGAFFALCDEGRQILRGMERSDSIVMDPHKTLFLPYGTGAVLVKDRQQLYESHHSHADYMQDVIEPDQMLSPADVSPELTKHFRGLRLWLPLKLLGVAPFRAALEEKLLLARYFHERLQEIDGFEVGPAPDLSVVTYRYVPARGDPNEFNRRLVEAIQADGRIFVTSTLLDGTFVLRLAVVSFRTHLADIDETIDVLMRTARRLEQTR